MQSTGQRPHVCSRRCRRRGLVQHHGHELCRIPRSSDLNHLSHFVPRRRRRAAAYLAKYATKGSDDHGVLDHRLPAGICRDTRLPEHLQSLVATAWELGGTEDLAEVGLQRWSHTCGFRGHFLTKSRRWSTTFGELRAESQRWRLAQRPDDQQAGLEESVVTAEWTFEGSGYLTAGDVCLARTVEDQLRLGRFVAREGSRLANGNDVGS